MNSGPKHEFALYAYGLQNLLSSLPPSGQLCITSSTIAHRLIHVLRLKPASQIILFDKQIHAQATIVRCTKSEIDFTISWSQANITLTPLIISGLPLLKREALEAALHNLVEVGVTTIQLLTTHNTRQRWTKKDHDRLERIAQAAAEQCKQFAFADINEPIPLAEFAASVHSQPDTYPLFFDPTGVPAGQILKRWKQHPTEKVHLLIGPEADLTPEEKEIIRRTFTSCALTPTILQAKNAALLAAGMVRALF